MGSQRTITGQQFMFMLVVSYLTAGIFSFPREVVHAADGGAIVSFLVTTVIAYGGAMLMAWIGGHFPGMTAVEWGDQIFPFRIHRVLATAGAVSHLIMGPTVLRIFGTLMKETFFQVTPTWILLTALILVAAYGALLGVEVLGRVTVITVPLLLGTVVVSYLLAFPYFELYRVRPAIPPLSDALSGAFHASLLYEGYAFILIVHRHLKEPQKSLRYVSFSFLITTLIFLLIYFATVATFGVGAVKVLSWPASQLLLLVRLRGWFAERLGLFVEAAWAGLMLLYTASHLWATSVAGQQIMGLKPKAYPWVLLGVTGFFAVVATLYRNIEQTEMIFRFLPWGGLWANLGLPLLQWAVGMARGSFRKGRTTGVT